MPVNPENIYLTNLLTKQLNCKLCNEETTHSKYKSVCDVCDAWACLDCADVSTEIYEIAERTKVKLNFVCHDCEQDLPKLKDLMKMQKSVNKTNADVKKLQGEVAANTLKINTYNQKSSNIEARLRKLEDSQYPTLHRQDAYQQYPPQALTGQSIYWPHQQSRIPYVRNQPQVQPQYTANESKKYSLIVYGIPENCENSVDQMKADFNTIKQLYTERVEIKKEDLRDLTRVGTSKPGQTRPIKITFNDMEQRMKVLTNNQKLRLDHDGDNTCTYDTCSELTTKHTHVYISTDKTKQEMETEKLLRQELKTRRDSGEENIIIRNGRIVNKQEITERTVRSYWNDVVGEI